ncbi:molybdopterin cofactor-binding domain-containing protein [Nocardioides sp. WS12]|uniref:xanthine dehydrogenase family protein molybdopterin-binding subunit n=1 Tax=Nocardioides sp. WS12 TaxID=2486272 RepID=UPI0015FBBAD7|nr:molybdopterin cofactor-binding domain-containing protein [Nocardioides sp. WS12]
MTTSSVTRRMVLKGTGSLVVGFALAEALGVSVADAIAANRGELRIDPTTHAGADDAWLILTAKGTTIFSARVELGTGVQTALTQIVVEELRLGMAKVEFIQGDTVRTPAAGTVGSKSIQQGGPLLRQAAATAYQALLAKAAAYLKAPASSITATKGKFTVNGTAKSVTYEKLLTGPDVLLTTSATAPVVSPSSYKIVGTSVPRVDIPGKALATFTYVSDLSLPGMLHGRVVRPNGRNAQFSAITQMARAEAIPGFVAVVQQDNFVGVVAETEYAASLIAAPATGIVVQWTAGAALAPMATLESELKDPANHYGTFNDDAHGDFAAAYAAAEQQLTASYFTPYQMHAAMGASCAVADVKEAPDPVTGIQATVWSGTQNVYNLRGAIATLLFGAGNASKVHVRYEEASGCYGHDGVDDAAADAALLSQAVKKPVRLQWTRQNEHGWEPLGEAAAHDMEAGITGGSLVAWHHRLYALTANSRPGNNNAGTLLAGTLKGSLPADLPANSNNSSGRNAPVTYEFADSLTDAKLVRSFSTLGATSRVAAAPLTYKFLRTTALRSLGGFSNSFANESFLDEVAHATGQDPLQIRLNALAGDPRAHAVVAALQSAWDSRPAGGNGVGAGLGFQQYEEENAYAATYAEVEVDPVTGKVRVTRVVVAHDCGLIINPDGLRNQIEGNVIQGISRTTHEEVVYNANGVTSVVWQIAPPFNVTTQYEVIRFNEVPTIECILIDRPNEPAWGAGEPAIGTIGGAVGNAVFAATGKRVRQLPMTPERVLGTPVE